jgi:hypothetical protein
MIEDTEIEALAENLTHESIVNFFIENKNKFVYFYYISNNPAPEVDTIWQFEAGELQVPIIKNESGSFAVMYSNKKLVHSYIQEGFNVGIVKCSEFVNIVKSLKEVNGIIVQCSSRWFRITKWIGRKSITSA